MSSPFTASTDDSSSSAHSSVGLPENLTLALLAVTVLVETARGGIALTRAQAGEGALAGAALLTTAVICFAMPGTRRYPALAVAPALLAPIVTALAGWDPIVEWSATSFLAFVIAAGSLPWWLIGPLTAAANLLAVFIAVQTVPHTAVTAIDVPSAISAAFAPCVAALLGEALRSQRARTVEAEQRHQQALLTHRVLAERAVAQERLRIARDLHDGVGHQIAVLSMRLGAAEVHAMTDPAAVSQDLAAARETVQQVLTETQSVLRFLRDQTNGAETWTESSSGSTEPVAAHGRIPDLVDEARGAGARVEIELKGLDRPLSGQLSAAVYRITQEALTNALRHGRGPVHLAVTIDDNGAHIVAVNRVRGRKDPAVIGEGTGFGLEGVRERAASVGGTIRTSIRGTSGSREFVLNADLPLHTSPIGTKEDPLESHGPDNATPTAAHADHSEGLS
ncbi:histidine kinase [Actinomyces viscosus]|uniref:sensor histidine kinase n=1 Tax=Actinomyces viscosus TaxID=1656 RepID=UPI0028EFB4E6|nr:histidine kinase [Actinomyces viscosus]